MSSDGPTLLRWGILGCANIARKNIDAIRSARGTNKLVAIASRDIAKARAFAAENGLDATVALFEGYSQLLDDATVDAVYIPLPTTLHLEWATKAAQRGKHILLEKPVATHAAEFLEIYRACELHGVLLMDGTMFMHNERLGALINQLRRHALDSVRISRLESAFSFHGNKAFLQSNIRVDQTADPLGALGDLGWYCIRLAVLAFSSRAPCDEVGLEWMPLRWPKSCSAICSAFSPNGKVPLNCEARVYFGDGPEEMFCFNASFLIPLRQNFEICLVSSASPQEDEIFECSDAFIPSDDAVSSFDIVRHAKSGFKSARVVETISTPMELSQQARMFENFSNIVKLVLKAGGAGVTLPAEAAAGADRERKFWARISLLTQAVVDACMLSMQRDGESVPVVQYEL